MLIINHLSELEKTASKKLFPKSLYPVPCFSDCFGVLDCEWCMVDSDGKTHLDKPYCALQKECFGGIVGAKSPYADGLGLLGEWDVYMNQTLIRCSIQIDTSTWLSSFLLICFYSLEILCTLNNLCPSSPPLFSPCRWGGGISEHDQERPCGSSRWGHHGMHHGACAGCVCVQTSDPSPFSPAHVTTGSTGWDWWINSLLEIHTFAQLVIEIIILTVIHFGSW